MKSKTILRLFALLAVLLAAPLAMAADALSPEEAAQIKFRAIQVDTSRYEDQGAGGYANMVKASVLAQAHQIFADKYDPRDPKGATLIIRVESVMWTNGGSWGFGGNRHGSAFMNVQPKDYMEGSGVITRGGRVLVDHHMLASLDSEGGYGQRRTDLLSNYYVAWLRKEMGM